MHTYHRIAVEADDREEAIALAEAFANEQSWSDWNQIHIDDVESVISYKDNPTKFVEQKEQACKWTQETITQAVELYGDISLRELLTNPKYDFSSFNQPVNELTKEQRDKYLEESLAVFKATRAFEVLNGRYTSDVMFYDTIEYTANPKWVNERVGSNPDRQWIVIVDYHF